MALFDTVKTLTIFFAPIIVPRIISFIRSIRQSIEQQRHIPLKPLTPQSSRALNILFVSAVIFFILSFPNNPHAPAKNIFALTSSRFSVPTEILFNRLSRLRPLTDIDSLLKAQFLSIESRKIYLRFGPETLLSCPFCDSEYRRSYLIYYIPSNVLLPHLFHLLVLGVVTSAPIVGSVVSKWRNKFFWAGFILLFVDLISVIAYNPYKKGEVNPALIPTSSYTFFYTARMLALTIFDAICAGLVYLSATNRFFLGFVAPTVSADEQIDEFIEAAGASIAGVINRLQAIGLVRQAVMRDPFLKARENEMWSQIMVAGGSVSEDGRTLLDDEEVAQAVSRALLKRAEADGTSHHGVDALKQGMSEATAFVDRVTAGLELQS